MRKLYNIFLFAFATILFIACSSNDQLIKTDESGDELVEIAYYKSNFTINTWDGTRSVETRATEIGLESESMINNIYILMLGSDVKRYFFENTTPTSVGVWDKTNEKVKINLSQVDAGSRTVYVIANVKPSLKSDLDNVSNISGMNAVLQSSNSPWSKQELGFPTSNTTDAANTALLMSGSKSAHNFINNHIISVPLTRAVAKIELNITLQQSHQDELYYTTTTGGVTETVYNYFFNFEKFDKNTYVIENTAKIASIATSGWKQWDDINYVASVDNVANVTKLSVITYVNETSNAGSFINIKLPYNDDGDLPPPEFGGETFQLALPQKVVRNTWYKYDITI